MNSVALRVHEGIWEVDYLGPIQEYIRLKKNEAAHAKMRIILNHSGFTCAGIKLVDKHLK